jgi:hypothetical protein
LGSLTVCVNGSRLDANCSLLLFMVPFL